MRFLVRTLVGPLVLCLSAASLAQPATEIALDIRGGPHEGSYRATSEDVTCSHGLAFGADSWGNQYSILTDDASVFSSLQLVVPSSAAAVSGTDAFLTTIGFGDLLAGTSYTVDGREGGSGEGTGLVTLQDSGDGAVVTIEGTTTDGVRLAATITCNEVLRVAGQAPDEDAPADGTLRASVGGARWDLQTTEDEAGCSPSFAEDGDLFFSYYPESAPEGLADFEFLLYDLEAALAGGSGLYLSLDGQRVYLDTAGGDGTGTATASLAGDLLTVSIQADDAGTPIQATVTCRIELD